MSQFNPIMESLSQIEIHKFESEMEDTHAELLHELGSENFLEVIRTFEPEVISWRGLCAPGTSDIEHAFLVCLTDRLEMDGTLEEQAKLRRGVLATLQYMRINGTLI